MGSSKTYRSVDVQSVEVARLVAGHDGQDLVVGVDVGKGKLHMVLYWSYESRSRPIVVRQPSELRAAIRLLEQLSQGRRMRVALEPSGTYGDAFRYGCSQAGLQVERVSGSASKKHSEVMDNTNSQHDGKDAGVIAELAFMGKSRAWPWEQPQGDEDMLRVHADMMVLAREETVRWTGRLEGRLARHWPEVLSLLDLQSQTLLQALVRYQSPAKLAEDPQAVEYLRELGGRLFSPEKAQAVVASARETVGVPVTQGVGYELKLIAEKLLELKQQDREHECMVERLGPKNPAVGLLAPALGKATATVLYLECGDPGKYPCSYAYLNALGLNLVEHSSGLQQGKLHISKRGSPRARKWLYLAGLRFIGDEGNTQAWYHRKVARDGGVKMRGVIGVMRKLARSIYHCCLTGEEFDSQKVFESHKTNKSQRRNRQRRGHSGRQEACGVTR